MWGPPIFWRGGYFWNWGYFWPWAIVGLAFWIVIIVGIGYLLYRLIKHPVTQVKAKEDALEILKKRYARGEISEEEFKEMKKNL